jgi:hypothetical protein
MTAAELRARLLLVVEGERYPRFRTFRDQCPEDVSDRRIRAALQDLVGLGKLVKVRRPRDPYWQAADNWQAQP